VYIAALSTTDGHLADALLEFSPNLTCIIGARGTCKSTIAETIRFLFNDDEERIAELLRPSEDEDSQSHEGLISATLKGGTAAASLIEEEPSGESRSTTIERDLSSQSRVYIDGVRAIADDDLLRKIEIYSQGELQDIAMSSTKRLALVDRPHRSVVDEWDQESRRLAGEIASRGPLIRELRDEIDTAQRLVKDGDELRARLREVQAGRPDLSPEIARLREEHQRRQQLLELARLLVGRYEASLSDLRAAADSFGVLGAEARPLRESGKDPLVRFGQLLSAASVLVGDSVNKLTDSADLRSNFEEAENEASKESAPYFESLKQEEVVTASIKAEDRLSEEVAKLDRIAERLSARQAALVALSEERRELRQRLRALRGDVFSSRLAEVERINAEFSEHIVLSLNHGTRTEGYRDRLNALLNGSRLRDQEGICQQIAAALPAERLISLVEDEDSSQLARVLNRDEGQMVRLLSHLASSDDLYDLESGIADDELDVTMFVDGVPRSVTEMSKGQKATALLPLLLRSAPYPLVLDQPEDDLDNRFIYETLIEKINALKTERQLIFVTHNANTPVIGDAERVLVMSMKTAERAAIEAKGNVEQTRDQIVSILEGGQRAFELRGEIYDFPTASSP
jgi:hypothetical protein